MTCHKFLVTILFLFSLTNYSPTQIATSSEAFGDQLNIGYVGQMPAYLNPFKIDGLSEKVIMRMIFGTGLIQQADRFGKPNSIIERVIYPGTRDQQGLLWKYVLKRNITFQNGNLLRNKDVRFTFDVLKKLNANILNNKLDFTNVESVELSGDLEVWFVLKQKDMNFDQKFTDLPILSENYYQGILKVGFDLFKSQNPIGYGPFRFEKRSEEEIILASHPHYVFGRPFLNRILFKFFSNEQELIDNFILGNIDLIEVQDLISAQRLHQLLKKEIKIFPTPRPEKKVYYLLLNLNDPLLKNVHTRTAIKNAVNSNDIVSRLLEQKGHIAYSVIDFVDSWFFKDLFELNFDPGLSMDLLNNVGWEINRTKGVLEKNGTEFIFTLVYEQNSFLEENIARAVKIFLAEVGINVKPIPVMMTEKQNFLRNNSYSAVIDSYSYYDNDIYNAVKMFYYKVLKGEVSPTNYDNPRIENTFAQADINSRLRKQVIQRFQIFLHQDTPVVFLFFDDKIYYAVQNRFKDIRVTISSGEKFYHRLNSFENWFVPKPLQKYPFQ